MNNNERAEILGKMVEAISILENCKEFALCIPEVRTNMVYATNDAKTPADVCAIDGRMTIVNSYPKASGYPKFGASSHMARALIELRKIEPSIRAGINFFNTPHFTKWLENYCKDKGWTMGMIDRSNEPDDMKQELIPSMPWKMSQLLKSTGGKVPKVGYENGAVGKEPVSVIMGADPVAIALELCEIARLYEHPKGW